MFCLGFGKRFGWWVQVDGKGNSCDKLNICECIKLMEEESHGRQLAYFIPFPHLSLQLHFWQLVLYTQMSISSSLFIIDTYVTTFLQTHARPLINCVASTFMFFFSNNYNPTWTTKNVFESLRMCCLVVGTSLTQKLRN